MTPSLTILQYYFDIVEMFHIDMNHVDFAARWARPVLTDFSGQHCDVVLQRHLSVQKVIGGDGSLHCVDVKAVVRVQQPLQGIPAHTSITTSIINTINIICVIISINCIIIIRSREYLHTSVSSVTLYHHQLHQHHHQYH